MLITRSYEDYSRYDIQQNLQGEVLQAKERNLFMVEV